MAASNYPPGWHEYVRAHHAGANGYVVAQTGECLEIGRQGAIGPQSRVAGRTFQPIRPRDLPALRLPASWFMGVLLCPGDDLRPVLTWIATQAAADRERVVLYLHPSFDQEAGAALLRTTNLENLQTTEFKGDWTHFHHLYGNDHAWQVWADRPAP